MGQKLPDNEKYLVADVGGTNTRIALAGPQDSLSQLRTFPNGDVRDLRAALIAATSTSDRPRYGVIAAAGREQAADTFRLTNRDWSFSRSELQQTLQLERLLVVNDFVAMAHSVSVLESGDFLCVGAGVADPRGNLLVCGPGTGFGVAALVRHGERPVAIATEAGHMRLGATNILEARLFERLAPAGQSLSIEDVLSGRGLSAISQNTGGGERSTEKLISAALAGEKAAAATIAAFMQVFGRIVGDLALAFDARGGVYIGGGVGRALSAFFQQPSFRRAFEEHPPYEGWLCSLPIFVITHSFPGLIGALQIARTEFAPKR